MFDPIPSDVRRCARDDVYAACAAALGVTPGVFARTVKTAVRAGYRGVDAEATAFLALADPQFGVYGRGGKRGRDATRAAIFRHCPRRQREADRRLSCAWARRGRARWGAGQDAKAIDPLDLLLAAEAAGGDDREATV